MFITEKLNCQHEKANLKYGGFYEISPKLNLAKNLSNLPLLWYHTELIQISPKALEEFSQVQFFGPICHFAPSAVPSSLALSLSLWCNLTRSAIFVIFTGFIKCVSCGTLSFI